MLHNTNKEVKGAKPLTAVRNETLGGSSQILQTSGHKEKGAGYSGGFSYLASHAENKTLILTTAPC